MVTLDQDTLRPLLARPFLDEHTLVVRAEKRLCDYVWLTGSYIFRRNISDQKSFDYSRHITSLGVEVRY